MDLDQDITSSHAENHDLRSEILSLVTPLERHNADPDVLADFILALLGQLGQPTSVADVNLATINSESFRENVYLFMGIDTDDFIFSFRTWLEGQKRLSSRNQAQELSLEALRIREETQASGTHIQSTLRPSQTLLGLAESALDQFVSSVLTAKVQTHHPDIHMLAVKAWELEYLALYFRVGSNKNSSSACFSVRVEGCSIRAAEGSQVAWILVRLGGYVEGVKVCMLNALLGRVGEYDVVPISCLSRGQVEGVGVSSDVLCS